MENTSLLLWVIQDLWLRQGGIALTQENRQGRGVNAQ